MPNNDNLNRDKYKYPPQVYDHQVLDEIYLKKLRGQFGYLGLDLKRDNSNGQEVMRSMPAG